MDLELSGQVAVVVGGASGIGKAICQKFAAEGATTVVWDIQPDEDSAAVQQMDCDVTNFNAVKAALKSTEESVGSVQHVVHAAAIGSGKFGQPFHRIPPESWRRVLEVNVEGLVHVGHAVTPSMVERKFGTITSISSVAGQIGSPTDPPYSASKAAGINFAQCMARDLAQHGIRVNSVCPGMVRTPLNRSVWKWWTERDPKNTLTYDEWAKEKIQQLVPLGRWQQPEDVADMVVFLASARAAQVTGQTINVDGGYVMHW